MACPYENITNTGRGNAHSGVEAVGRVGSACQEERANTASAVCKPPLLRIRMCVISARGFYFNFAIISSGE